MVKQLNDMAEAWYRSGFPVTTPWSLGPGFANGQWVRLADPEASLIIPAEAKGQAVLDVIKSFASDIPKGGAVAGFLSYELAGSLEPTLNLPASPDRAPLVQMARFRHVDMGDAPARGAPPPKPIGIEGDLTRPAAYEAQVRAVIDHIREGDAFQVNISRRQSAWFAPDAELLPKLFGNLVAKSSAAYAAMIPTENGGVLSNSPELLLRVDGQQIVAEPVKGTRPRGTTVAEDEALAQELLASQKDRAENIMIADLMRNDLAKVCQDDEIKEEAICALNSLPHVHHLYSRIAGNLRAGVRPMEALLAAFPCGSITGAPKHEAMKIIAEQEGEGRGPYCGTIFYIPDEGPAVFSVAIRTGVLSPDRDEMRLDVRTGGGVTILSDPAAEYQETVDKAYPFRVMTT